MEIKTKPKKGIGERFLECRHYETCLDIADVQNWKSFNCESCDFYKAIFKQMETPNRPDILAQIGTPEKKKENTRICEHCKEKITLSPTCPLCPSCMAKRSNESKKTAQDRFLTEKTTHSIGKAKKTQHRGNMELKKKAPEKAKMVKAIIGIEKTEKTQQGGSMALTVEFDRHATVLDGIKKIAEYEMRPLEMEVIYILKEYLRNNEIDKST